MKRKYNTVGGGAKTNINGLTFERDTDLLDAFSFIENCRINILPYDEVPRTAEIFINDKLIGLFSNKIAYIRDFLSQKG